MAAFLKTNVETSELCNRMRQVVWTDKDGFKRVSLIRDTDPEELASSGIPVGPPDLELVDWEEVKRDLNNFLVDHGLLTYRDLMRQNSGVSKAVRSCLTSKIVNLFKFMEMEGNDE